MCTIYGRKKGILAPVLFTLYWKKGPYILHILHKNFNRWKQVKFFCLEICFCVKSISNCKLFEVIWFEIVLYLTLKLLRAPFITFAHNFCFIFKNIWLASELIKCGSYAYQQNNAKAKCGIHEWGSTAYLKKGAWGDRIVHLPNIQLWVKIWSVVLPSGQKPHWVSSNFGSIISWPVFARLFEYASPRKLKINVSVIVALPSVSSGVPREARGTSAPLRSILEAPNWYRKLRDNYEMSNVSEC